MSNDSDLWWDTYQKEKKKNEELMQTVHSVGRALEKQTVGDLGVDLVLVQEHEKEMAKLATRREVLLACIPRTSHFVWFLGGGLFSALALGFVHQILCVS